MNEGMKVTTQSGENLVGDLDNIIRRDQKIFRLDITMDNFLKMH
jgi:hypothetical protein